MTALRQQRHRFSGKDAVGTATVRDDLLLLGKVLRAASELVDRDRDGPLEMTCVVLFAGTNIEQHDLTAPHAAEQSLPIDTLELLVVFEEFSGDPIDLGELR